MIVLTERLQMRLDADTLSKLDDLRRLDPGLPPRSEVIRTLIHDAWAAALDKTASKRTAPKPEK